MRGGEKTRLYIAHDAYERAGRPHYVVTDGGITRESWEQIQRVYDDLLAVQMHIVNGYPLARTR